MRSGNRIETQALNDTTANVVYRMASRRKQKKEPDAMRRQETEGSENNGMRMRKRKYYKGLLDAKTINNQAALVQCFNALDFTGPSIFVFPISAVKRLPSAFFHSFISVHFCRVHWMFTMT